MINGCSKLMISVPDFFAASLHLHLFHAFFGGGTVHRNHQFWTTIYHLLVYSSTRLQPKKKCSRFFGLDQFARLLVYPSTLTKSGLKNWKVWFFSSMTLSEAFSSGTPLKSPVVFLMCCFFKFDRVDFLWVEQDLGWIRPPPLLTLVFSVFWCDLLVYSFTGLRAFF